MLKEIDFNLLHVLHQKKLLLNELQKRKNLTKSYELK